MRYRGYIHPKSLSRRHRIYIETAKMLGAKIIASILEWRSGEKYIRALVEIDADAEIIKALKRLGIKVSRKKYPAYFSPVVLAELIDRINNPYPIGVGELGQVIYVDVDAPIALDNPYLALAIVDGNVLWLDYRGDETPLKAGFKEVEGLGIPRSPSRIGNIANDIARLLGVRPEVITASFMHTGEDILEDEELKISSPIDPLFRWMVVVRDRILGGKIYIDFSGLPRKMQVCSLKIALNIWDW